MIDDATLDRIVANSPDMEARRAITDLRARLAVPPNAELDEVTAYLRTPANAEDREDADKRYDAAAAIDTLRAELHEQGRFLLGTNDENAKLTRQLAEMGRERDEALAAATLIEGKSTKLIAEAVQDVERLTNDLETQIKERDEARAALEFLPEQLAEMRRERDEAQERTTQVETERREMRQEIGQKLAAAHAQIEKLKEELAQAEGTLIDFLRHGWRSQWNAERIDKIQRALEADDALAAIAEERTLKNATDSTGWLSTEGHGARLPKTK